MLRVAGPLALAEFRKSGDPAKQAAARAKIGTRISLRNRERAAWDRDNDRPDPKVFSSEILPKLEGVSTGQIAAATGLSKNFVAAIKAGKHVPHAMHWDAFKHVVDSPNC